MAELKGYYNQEVLDEMLHENRIGRLEYIYHHSEQMKEDYSQFCREGRLDQDEASAEKFFDARLEREEKSHTEYLD